MLIKLIQGTLVTTAIVILPALGSPAILKTPHLWILIGTGVAASFFQPKYNPFKCAPDSKDRGTAAQIIWSIYITQLFMLIEAIYFRYPESVSRDFITAFGLALIVVGLAIRTWGVMQLGSFFTWYIASQKNQKVIRTGPYRFIRHPGYSGAFLTYTGTTLFLHTWVAFILTAVALSFAFYRRVHLEEMELRQSLGSDYVEYCRSVRRFIPWIL